jgi:hypothetical protein
VITYTLNQVPVSPTARFDGASESARIMAEVFERLVEMDEEKHDSAAGLVRRLATLADISPDAFRTVLRFGSGDMTVVLLSYADQTKSGGVTRQALHYRWQEECRAVRLVFPELARLMQDARESINHKEGAMSSADALRSSMGERT